MQEHGTLIWNGEFDRVYADARQSRDAETINQEKYILLGERL
jgi:hypothetical protein